MGSQFNQDAAQGPAGDAGAAGGAQGAGGGASKEGGGASKRFRLYVGSLAYSTTTAALRQAFGEFGTLLDAEVVFDRANHSKGFGFVSYGDEESMKKAIDKMNGFELDGRKLEVTVAMPQGPKFGMNGGYMQRGGMEIGRGPPRGYRIVIHGVPPTITWRNLKDYLREAGCEVKYADIIGPGVGMGEFGTPAERVNAVKTLNGKDLKGSKIFVRFMDESDMRFDGGWGFGPRPGMFNEHFGGFGGGFDMFGGPGFDQFPPYGMPPPDFNMMGFPPPPAVPGWGPRGPPRHPGYSGMGPHPGMGGGFGRGNPGPRGWGGGYGYDRPGGRGSFERGDSMRGYDRRGDMPSGYSGYERPPDSGYSRGAQSSMDGGPVDERNPQGSRSYGQYSDRYTGSGGEGYMRQYDGAGKDGYGGYPRVGNQEAQGGYGGRYDAGSQNTGGYDRSASDMRGYSGYNRTGQEDGRSGYGDYRGTGQQDAYNSGSYGYGASGYSKQAVTGGGGAAGGMTEAGGMGGDRSSYDYSKMQGTPDTYAKYRATGEYGRGDRPADYSGYGQQDRRAYDYGRPDGGRSYTAADVPYKRAESDYYGDRRGDYGNGRSYREEDARSAGGVDRRRNHAHRVGPYER